MFQTLGGVWEEGDRFIAVCADIDLTYKITNSLGYEAARFALLKFLEEAIGERFYHWRFEGEEGNCIFIVKTQDNGAVRELKRILESAKKEEKSPVVAAISKPYKGIAGIKNYSNLQNLNAAKAVDVCYKILCSAIDARTEDVQGDKTRYFKEYMSVAVAYIEEHLDDEELSIVSVASHIYLNPVYFGRVFKNTFHMTFKKYLLQQRMEKAKRLLEEGNGSVGDICEQVGIHNPSYFSHLFKQYTGKLPSEYKKEYEV